MTSQHRFPATDLHALASSYVLGALDDAERTAFENHLRRGCAACEAELRSFERVACDLAVSVAVEPPPDLRRKLLSKLSQAPRAPGIIVDDGGLLLARSAEVAWKPLTSGIEYKLLFSDRTRQYSTSLVRMEAGAYYPSHRHKDIEELFILSGDLHVSGEILRAGDYCRASIDTVHEATRSDTGCLFLLMGSQHNELVA